jgi:hypothetical protein
MLMGICLPAFVVYGKKLKIYPEGVVVLYAVLCMGTYSFCCSLVVSFIVFLFAVPC